MNNYDFSNRIALVTGGARGIGAATAERLLAGGARVAALDLDLSGLPPGVVGIEGDVACSADIEAAVRRVEKDLGPIDILVASAGISGRSARTTELDDAEWDRVLTINARGTFAACRAVVPGMLERGYGRIVNVASIAGKEGNPYGIAYSASKAAVICLTKSIGRDLAGTGILVNCVAPAVIDTPMLDDMTSDHVAYMVEKIPLQRSGRPDEVASMIAYLVSEELSFSTGACFDLSGGRAVY